jgi:hypothetical protein
MAEGRSAALCLRRSIVVVVDSGNVPAIHRTRFFGLRHCIVVRIVFVEGFLEVVLQFLLRLSAALTHGPHLLRCRSGMGVLVWAVILRAVSGLLTHTEIVPPCVSVGKAPLHV